MFGLKPMPFHVEESRVGWSERHRSCSPWSQALVPRSGCQWWRLDGGGLSSWTIWWRKMWTGRKAKLSTENISKEGKDYIYKRGKRVQRLIGAENLSCRRDLQALSTLPSWKKYSFFIISSRGSASSWYLIWQGSLKSHKAPSLSFSLSLPLTLEEP